jgi:hypothetical protein
LEHLNNLIPPGSERWEGDYDLLVVADAGDDALLVEVKTIRTDANHQTRLGLGQLLYYEHFDVAPSWPDATVHRVLAVDKPLDAELVAFLDAHEVGLLVLGDGEWAGDTRAQGQLAPFGMQLPALP